MFIVRRVLCRIRRSKMVRKTVIVLVGLLMIFGMAAAGKRLRKQVKALTKRVEKLEGCDGKYIM